MAAVTNSWVNKRGPGGIAIAFWILLALLPFGERFVAEGSFDYYMFMGQAMLINAIAILGLNLLIGFNGQISLGHSAFFAVGAYTAAILMNFAGWPYWATLPVAAVVCFVAGFLFGFPALKLEGHYLALATFTLAIAVPQLLKYKPIGKWTGGVGGLLLDKPDAPGWSGLGQDQFLYYVCLLIAILAFWAVRNVLRGRGGSAMMAIRDHVMAAGTMGIDTARYKTVTFGLSAAITGVAGALSAITVAFVAPDSFTLQLAVSFLVGLVVGGIASLPGCLIGGAFIVLIQNSSQSISDWMKATFSISYDVPAWAIYGVLLIALMYFMPRGIMGGVEAVTQRIVNRRGT
ncbi:branched-chain amino acid ABC transporter permease [Rhodopila sp.]|jgi:branched-chain amino acid transport system permease protein|uniref:branched-chain amino acid ABC transporter permease n=1 Tax=Rhodopila sp. TaxID=2480087 RepID=UPI002C006345|nr:branched-chain amino acid ABC transporter permease [Rhodopila sp.]HVZ06434.1 branched-chain amino acid ABC transporter permease [Rhodopila sp.]